MSPLRVLVSSGRFRRAVTASAALLIAGWLPLVDSAPASAQSGRAPVTEIFTGPPPPSTTVSVASLALLKTATPSVVTTAGQNVDYSFLVVNTGNVTLTNVTAADTDFSGTGTPPVITCPTGTLSPGMQTPCAGAYTVTQADIDAGSITNTAVATGTPPTGPAVTSNPSTATVTNDSAASLALLKTVTPAVVTTAGQTVTYAFLVVNTGNVTLTNVTAADTDFSGTGTPPVIACPTTTLVPQDSTTCTGRYTVTQADIDAGGIVNTGVATGTPSNGLAVGSEPSTATVTAVGGELPVTGTSPAASLTTAGVLVTVGALLLTCVRRTGRGCWSSAVRAASPYRARAARSWSTTHGTFRRSGGR